MSARRNTRIQDCTREEALNRLRQAETFLQVADMVIAGVDDDVATPGVAAAVAVLAGIAASDAACCAQLNVRPRGQDHMEAVTMLEGVHPLGPEMAKDLRRLLTNKDDAHYGLRFVGRGEAKKMVDWAKRLTENARHVIETAA